MSETGATDEQPGSPSAATSGSDLRWAVGLGAATFLFLAVAGYPRQWTLGLLINDEYWYALLARNLYEGLGYVTEAMLPIQAPHHAAFPVVEGMKQSGYPLLAALAWSVFGVSVRAMLVISATGIAALAAAVFLLSRQLGWRRGTSLFVAAATVVNPTIAQYGVQALPESLYLACFTFVVLFVLRDGIGATAAAGTLNAVLILFKGHGIIYVPVFLAYLWMRGAGGLREAIRPRRRKAIGVAVFAGSASAVLLLAAVLLPSGSVQLFEAGQTYSHGFLVEVGRQASDAPYLELEPPDPLTYISQHPGQFLDKVARQVRRTKTMIDALAAPAFDGVLFPALLFSIGLLAATAVSPRRGLPAADSRQVEPYLLFVALIAMTLAFFWPIYLTTRFLTQTLPLMLLLCIHVAHRFGPPRHLSPPVKRIAVVALVTYFVAYPAAVTVWDSYRQPMKYIGSMLAVRYVDYDEVAENVRTLLPDDPIVITDMAHEINWLTGVRTILFPTYERDLRYLVERFDVDAVYEHPLLIRGWPAISERFTLVDDADGHLWVRKRAER